MPQAVQYGLLWLIFVVLNFAALFDLHLLLISSLEADDPTLCDDFSMNQYVTLLACVPSS